MPQKPNIRTAASPLSYRLSVACGWVQRGVCQTAVGERFSVLVSSIAAFPPVEAGWPQAATGLNAFVFKAIEFI